MSITSRSLATLLRSRTRHAETRDSENGIGTRNLLPFELVSLILTIAHNEREAHHAPWFYTKKVLQPTLLASSQVCKSWNGVATGLLYKDICLTRTRNLTALSITLLSRKHLRDLVQSLFFTRFYANSGDEWISFCNWWDLERIYNICPRLRSETFKAGATPSYRVGILKRARDANAHPLRVREINTEVLTRLELESVNQNPEIYFPASLDLPALQELVIKNFTYRDTAHGKLKWPRMPRLRRLCLYNCAFIDQDMPFPEGSHDLRVLEIVGGLYWPEHFWTDLSRVGTKLELATIAPVQLTSRPHDNDLTFLSSLVQLRLSTACFVTDDDSLIVLPPSLIHLVILEMRHNNRNPSLSAIQNQVMRLVEEKSKGTMCTNLETVRISAKTNRPSIERQEELSVIAERAGVKFRLFGVAPKTIDKAFGMVYKLSPIF